MAAPITTPTRGSTATHPFILHLENPVERRRFGAGIQENITSRMAAPFVSKEFPVLEFPLSYRRRPPTRPRSRNIVLSSGLSEKYLSHPITERPSDNSTCTTPRCNYEKHPAQVEERHVRLVTRSKRKKRPKKSLFAANDTRIDSTTAIRGRKARRIGFASIE